MTRRLAAAAPLVVVLVAATACGGDASRAAPVSIRVQVSGEPEETAVYGLMAEAFERVNPGIRVRVDAVARKSDHLTKLTTSFAAGRPPDVFLLNLREYAPFVARGAVLPVGERLRNLGFSPDEYFRAPLDAFTLDGALQCAPSNASSAVIFFNKVLLARAGLPPPPESWDWRTFASYARAMTGGGNHGIGIDPTITRLAPFVWSAGGEIVDDRTTRLTLATPEARRALEFVSGLVRDGLSPSQDEVAAQSLEDRFAAGRLGMLMTSRREVPGFREIAGLDFDVAPLPAERVAATMLHSDAFCVAAKSSHPDAALRFVSFAIGEQGQTIGALSGRIVPALRTVAGGPFLDPAQLPDHDGVFLEQLERARVTPALTTWPEIEVVLEELLTRLFYERAYGVAAFARDAQERTRSLFAEAAADVKVGSR